jgi:hypothetical protein
VTIRGEHCVSPAEVGTEQLIGTIEEVETHEQDPTSESSVDPWTTFHEEFSGLGDQLRDTYRKVAADAGPTEQEIQEAFSTLAGAWNQIAGSVASALRDPEVRHRLKDAGTALATAVGRTIVDLGTELRDQRTKETGSVDEEE